MTTPRVTEIPLALAAVEADPFIEVFSRNSDAQRRLGGREAQARQVNRVRRVMRLRAVRSRKR